MNRCGFRVCCGLQKMIHKAGCTAQNSLKNHSEYCSSVLTLSHLISSWAASHFSTILWQLGPRDALATSSRLVGIQETWQASYLPERRTNIIQLYRTRKPYVDANPMTWFRSSSALLVDPNKGKVLASAREESQIKGVSPEMLFYSTCYWLALFSPHITPRPFHLMRQEAKRQEARAHSRQKSSPIGLFHWGQMPSLVVFSHALHSEALIRCLCLFDTLTHTDSTCSWPACRMHWPPAVSLWLPLISN